MRAPGLAVNGSARFMHLPGQLVDRLVKLGHKADSAVGLAMRREMIHCALLNPRNCVGYSGLFIRTQHRGYLVMAED